MLCEHMRGLGLDELSAAGAERDAMGRERYGVPLATGNGRSALVDAYQEALDQCAYLAQHALERGGSLAECELLRRSIALAEDIRAMVPDRWWRSQ
jgi:hypothetical protein